MSGRQRGEPGGLDRKKRPTRPADGRGRKQKAADIGRALRTIYDDTLRESVPDDFVRLLGKLS